MQVMVTGMWISKSLQPHPVTTNGLCLQHFMLECPQISQSKQSRMAGREGEGRILRPWQSSLHCTDPFYGHGVSALDTGKLENTQSETEFKGS